MESSEIHLPRWGHGQCAKQLGLQYHVSPSFRTLIAGSQSRCSLSRGVPSPLALLNPPLDPVKCTDFLLQQGFWSANLGRQCAVHGAAKQHEPKETIQLTTVLGPKTPCKFHVIYQINDNWIFIITMSQGHVSLLETTSGQLSNKQHYKTAATV